MAILNNFEVTILVPDRADHETGSRCNWTLVSEYNTLNPSLVATSTSSYCQKYIGIAPKVDPFLGHQLPCEFAVDFKIHCGFTFVDNDETEFLVFRTFLDDNKIGSGFVKRERWQRSGSYRVRKKGRRFWVPEEFRWIEQKWHFDQGLHGTIRVEVWRERVKPPCSGSWNHPGLPAGANEFGDFIDLTDDSINVYPKLPRVRHTSKIDEQPIAIFSFEYRSEGMCLLTTAQCADSFRNLATAWLT